MRFFTTEQLGEKQALTPEGFLLCEDVPVARTGMMTYAAGEVPVNPGPNGLITIIRDEDEVFREEFIASLNGKPAVDNHPPTDVDPSNWREYAVGTGLNPRRGTGLQADLLVMDIILTDPRAIEEVRNGKREISLGYDADYVEIEPGRGVQKNLIGNHIALVDAGRCGPRCAIGDRKGDELMKTRDDATRTKVTDWWNGLKAKLINSVKPEDQAQLKAVLDEEKIPTRDDGVMGAGEGTPGEDPTHIHIHGGNEGGATRDDEAHSRLDEHETGMAQMRDDIEALKQHTGYGAKDEEAETAEEVKEEAPAGTTSDAAAKVRDSSLLGESFQETVAAAEILAPGIRIPTYDQKAQPRKTLDQICKLRRTALDLSYATPEGRGMIEELNGKPLELDNMSCGAVRTLFRAAVGMKKRENNSARTGDRIDTRVGGGMGVKGKMTTPADLNKRMADYYSK